MTPAQRSYRARAAAYSRWARPTARQEQADAARAALWRRFERQVDPDSVLDEETRHELSLAAARAHSAKMNLARRRPPE
jgi:hypothetical protein